MQQTWRCIYFSVLSIAIFVANILIQHRISWTLECGSFFKGREIPICVIRMSDFYLNHSFEICVRIRFQSSSEWVEGSLKLSLCRFMCNIRSLSWIDLSDGSFAHHWDKKSVNLQYITLGCLNDGTKESSTKSLMFQVLFFFTLFIDLGHSKLFTFIFVFF